MSATAQLIYLNVMLQQLYNLEINQFEMCELVPAAGLFEFYEVVTFMLLGLRLLRVVLCMIRVT